MTTTKNPEVGTKQAVASALKAMKTSSVKQKTVEEIVDEIMKRGRTDKVVSGLKVDERPKGLPKESKNLKQKGKMIKEEDEEIENEEDEEEETEGEEEEEEEEVEGGEEEAEAEEGEEEEETEGEEEEEEEGEAEFDVEENPEDFADEEGETEKSSEDIDAIISDLLKQEDIELNVDAEKGKVTITDKDTENKGVNAVKGDVELTGEEEVEGEEGEGTEEGEEEEIENLEEAMENDLNTAVNEEETVRNQMNEMLATFGKTYPKIFNEQFINKLGLIVEMYSNAKAKVAATEKINKIVSSIDVYMEKVERKFKRENAKKLQEALDNTKKIKLLKEVKHLLEAKLGKVNPAKINKKVKKALIKLYKENKILTEKNKNLREAIFNIKTNYLFEMATRSFDPATKSSIANLLEGFDYKNTREFKNKLDSAVKVVKEMNMKKAKELKPLRENLEKSKRFALRQRPIRRSDGILTTHTIREALRKRKAEILRENVDSERSTVNSGEPNFDEMEKYIYG